MLAHVYKHFLHFYMYIILYFTNVIKLIQIKIIFFRNEINEKIIIKKKDISDFIKII